MKWASILSFLIFFNTAVFSTAAAEENPRCAAIAAEINKLILHSQAAMCNSDSDCEAVAGPEWNCTPVGQKKYTKKIEVLTTEFKAAGCPTKPAECPQKMLPPEPVCRGQLCFNGKILKKLSLEDKAPATT